MAPVHNLWPPASSNAGNAGSQTRAKGRTRLAWDAAADAGIEVLLIVAIGTSSFWSVLVLTTEEEPPHPYDIPLISAAIGLSVVAAFGSLASIWSASAHQPRTRLGVFATRLMLSVTGVGFVAAVLTAVPAEWGLMFEPCCQGVTRMQRLAASQCAIACHVSLVALRIRIVLRWRIPHTADVSNARDAAEEGVGAAGQPTAVTAHVAAPTGAPAEADAARQAQAAGAQIGVAALTPHATGRQLRPSQPADSEYSAAPPSSYAFARVAPHVQAAPIVLLWEIASWALTLGAVLTVNWGFVTCNDFLRGCASFHSWAIEWTVFALWPLGSAVAISTLAAAHRLGRACVCRAIECGLPLELMVVRSIAVGQAAATGILLAVVAVNAAYGTSGAGQLGADLQLGPGIGSLGCHAALAVMRAREAAYVRAHTTFGSARTRRESREANHDGEGAERA